VRIVSERFLFERIRKSESDIEMGKGSAGMTDEHIEKTKLAIASAENIPADRKAELLDLLSKLKPAIAKVLETHHEDARSIARLVEASAHQTIHDREKPEQSNRLLDELRESVQNFEATHPQLAAFVNQYSTVLSALGI
jgi:hypothetical protein